MPAHRRMVRYNKPPSYKRKWEAFKTTAGLAKKAYNTYKRHKSGNGKKAVKEVAQKSNHTTINAIATRASFKTKGRKNVKSIVHRKKQVKVSRSLRKKVQKVIDGNSFKGTYSTIRFGTIGITTSSLIGPANNQDIDFPMGGYADQLAFQKQPVDTNGYTRWWFGQALASGASTAATSLADGGDWQFFSPLKIVDAASVLWNNKAIDADYGIQAGNFNTVVDKSTGVPITHTEAVPNIKGLQILVDNSYVKFTIKNNSQRTMKVTIYNCVPNIKFPEAMPLQALKQALITETDGANSAYFASNTADFSNFEQAQALLVNPSFEPKMAKTFAASWKYEKKVLRISGGEAVNYSIQGPRGYLLDYRKLWDAGIDKQSLAYKQTTCCVMMSVEADLVYTITNIEGIQGVSGHYISGTSIANSIGNPISMSWEEVIRVSIPEIAGFTKNAIGDTAGAAQLLNLRIPRRAFGNFSAASTGVADPKHDDFDVENVGILIPQSIHE